MTTIVRNVRNQYTWRKFPLNLLYFHQYPWILACTSAWKGLKNPRDLCPFIGQPCAHILVQLTIYRRLQIGRDGHLDQSVEMVISTNQKPTIYRSLYVNAYPGIGIIRSVRCNEVFTDHCAVKDTTRIVTGSARFYSTWWPLEVWCPPQENIPVLPCKAKGQYQLLYK